MEMDFRSSKRAGIRPLPGNHRSQTHVEPGPEDLARLGKIAAMIDATHSTLICRIRKSISAANRVVANLPDYLDTIRAE